MGGLRPSPAQWLLAAVFLASSAAHLAVTDDPALPGRVVLPEMWFSPAARPEAAHPELPDGVVMQPAPEGSVPREFPPLRKAASGDVASWSSPPAEIGDDPSAGRKLFSDFCSPCHGGRGQGDGQVIARGFPAPPVLTAEAARSLSDSAVFQLLTFGRNNMPPYRFQLTQEERRRVIQYLRELQRQATSGAAAQGAVQP